MKRKKEPIEVLLKPINQFIHQEASGGILLMICTVIALAWANSPWSDFYHHLWQTHLVINLGNILNLDYTIHHWINDGLMVIFFFTVGLAIKRELLVGELSSLQKASLPIAGALGGMIAPAIIYAIFNSSGEGENGWGIPMATDIAFVVGIMALLGPRVPLTLSAARSAARPLPDARAHRLPGGGHRNADSPPRPRPRARLPRCDHRTTRTDPDRGCVRGARRGARPACRACGRTLPDRTRARIAHAVSLRPPRLPAASSGGRVRAARSRWNDAHARTPGWPVATSSLPTMCVRWRRTCCGTACCPATRPPPKAGTAIAWSANCSGRCRCPDMPGQSTTPPAPARDGITPTLQELISLRGLASGRREARLGRHGHSGRAPSPLRGRGMEYAESREYVAGDDARHIDWRLTARTGRAHEIPKGKMHHFFL